MRRQFLQPEIQSVKSVACSQTPEPVVRMRGIVKRFPGIVANAGVDFDLEAGEVHTLLGENGAGKSTLMQILSGLYRPDAGEIFIRGRQARFRSPRDAIAAGVGMIYQHFMLVEKHTVTENVILGLRRFGEILDYRRARGEIERISGEYGMPVDPEAAVWQLSVGQQQRVEILKMLLRGAEILILDEPTAVLTPAEAADLFRTVRALKAQGKTVVFISHKLDEVMEISDRITVLRRGKNVAVLDRDETGERELARLMVGREVCLEIACARAPGQETALEVSDLRARDDRFLPALRGIGFRVRRGEILGLAGVSGNGQKELEEILCGTRRAEKGRVILLGEEVTNLPPREIIARGLACIPADRLGTGAAGGLDYASNIVLKDYRNPPFTRGFFLDRAQVRARAESLQKEFDIRIPSPAAPAASLSGGNLQKVILARELSSHPKFLLAVHPTRGLDIGACEFTRKTLERIKCAGTGILLISEDLQELLCLCDRIAVIFQGRLTGILDSGSATREKLGLLMTGQELTEGEAAS